MVPGERKRKSKNAGNRRDKRRQQASPSVDSSRNAHELRPGHKMWAGKNSLRLTLGMTCSNRNCFAVDPHSGTALYPASGVAVLLDTLSCKQLGYIPASKQCISCVNFSPNGHYILLGEQGYMPAVRVWSRALDQEVANFQGHEYGVAYAAFSGNMDLLVSLGTNHDGYIFVYSWPSKERISCNRFAESIYAMSFSRLDPFFVTCGLHHIRFWYPDINNLPSEANSPKTLLGRSVIMRANKTRTFVDVAFGTGRSETFVYSVTNCGLICKINSQRHVTNFLTLQKTEVTTVQVSDDQLFIGTVSGHVHFVNAITMQYKYTIAVPLDASLFSYTSKPSSAAPEAKEEKPRGKMYLGVDSVHKQLTAVLDNGDLCIWDIGGPDITKRKFFMSGHNAVVSGLDICLKSPANRGGPLDMTFSVAHDGTMRQWSLSMDCKVSCRVTKALYTGNYNSQDSPNCDTEVMTVIKANQVLKLIVVGDSKGLITVYDAVSLKPINTIVRHSRGITVLSFYTVDEKNLGAQLMLSGGRDRLINVYDIKKDFHVLNSLCMHSGSILALAMIQGANNLMLISSALDRNVIMSCISNDTPHHFTCTPRQCRHTTASVIEIRVCVDTHWAVLGKSNAVVTIIDTRTFQIVRVFRACKDNNATLERLCLDKTGALLFVACSDRSINLLSVPLGHRLACMTGHATPVSGLAITSDAHCLVSSSRDGCVFIWELSGRASRRARYLFKIGIRKARVKAKKALRATNSSKPVEELAL